MRPKNLRDVYNDRMNQANQGVVRVGPAGWSYEDWKGIVYGPDQPRSVHALDILCPLFDTVEVNSSFYRPPNPKHCTSWVAKVAANPRFKFTVKLWERFTHKRSETPTDADVAVFKEGIAPLAEAGKLGAILVQFPWSFKRTPENRRWLAMVAEAFAEYPLALEVRHASWNQPEVFEALTQRGIAFCNIDQPLFRDSLEATDAVTARVGYVRLHGRNAGDWFREEASRDDRYNYLYSEEELRPWVEKVERIREMVDEAYVITNNHYRGQAVVNALELQLGLGVTMSGTVPRHLIDEYPRLKRLFEEPAVNQGTK
jgi:uncharacterized protein YecE (DUF72 family)